MGQLVVNNNNGYLVQIVYSVSARLFRKSTRGVIVTHH